MASNSKDDIEIVSASPKLRAPFTPQNHCEIPAKKFRSASTGRPIYKNVLLSTTLNATSTPTRHARISLLDCANEDVNEIVDVTQPIGLETTKIKVYVRIRPTDNDRKCAEISEDGKHVSIKQQESCNNALDFACDKVFGEQSTQKEVYETIASSMIPKFFEGRNVCVFAYGQTGSGKTHSMLGGSADPGMLRRFGRELFETVLVRGQENETTEIEVSFYEIYKEKAYDLLSGTNVREALRLRGTDTAYLEDLISIPVTSQAELEKALNKGLSKRATAATLVNSLSSRSHAIFQISLCRNQKETVDGVVRENRSESKWYFVDLAGSECLKMVGQNGYENKGETASINCSLLALQKVIELKSQGSSSGYASYRESVLTYLLKECFGGNSVTSLLATISPEQQYVTQSIATLRFASKAAKVQQASRQNVDPLVMVVKGLKAENDELQAEVQRLRNQTQLSTESITQLCKSTSTTNSTFTSTVLETPCIVELMSDKSLNQTFKIPTDETGMEISAAAEENPLVRFLYQQPSTKSRLTVLGDNVAVNGVILDKDSELELTHGDKIVLGGLRFLVFVDQPNATIEDCVPSYEKVKLEFVESTFPIAKDKLIKQAREEFLSDKEERLRELNEELEQAKQELEQLKAVERPQDKHFTVNSPVPANGEENFNRTSEIEEEIKDMEELKEHLVRASDEEEQANLFRGLTAEEKMELLNLEAHIATANNIMKRFGKQNLFLFKLLPNSSSELERVSVRLINLKKKSYVDLLCRVFEIEIYDKLVEIFQSSATSKDGRAEVEIVIHEGNWNWNKGSAGRRSNILTTALCNSMKHNGNVSNVSELERSFRRRASVISEVLDSAKDHGERFSFLEDQLKQLRQQQQLDQQENFSDSDLTRNLLIASTRISRSFEQAVNAISSCQRTSSTSSSYEKPKQKPSTLNTSNNESEAISAVHRFSHSADALKMAAMCSLKVPSSEEIIREMCDAASLICNNKIRWILAVSEKSDSSNLYAQKIEDQLNLFYSLIGRHAYLRNERMENEFDFKQVRKNFEDGVLKSIEELSDDTEQMMQRYTSNKSKQAVIIRHLYALIRDLSKYITTNPYDEDLAYDILRPLIYYKNRFTGHKINWTTFPQNIQLLINRIGEFGNDSADKKLKSLLQNAGKALTECINTASAPQTEAFKENVPKKNAFGTR
ncbi:kinesin motor domain-containing protein [Ditylenchus destructor]|nr:kinesin motor domain-containing protein [Ditylenchus destructor]